MINNKVMLGLMILLLFSFCKETESEELYNSEFLYEDNQDGTVTDTRTNLVWQRCSLGKNNDRECSGITLKLKWEEAIVQCQALNLAGKKWRLPTKEELKSTIIKKKTLSIPFISLSIDETAFPKTMGGAYWSSSVNASDQQGITAWGVIYGTRVIGFFNKEKEYYVRCVQE